MASKTSSREIIENYLEAMRHPLREKIWVYLFEHGVSSPKEIAEKFDETIPNVSHHAKRLTDLGCAELVDKRPVRGAIEHFYRSIRPVLVDDDEWNYLLEHWPAFADWKLATFMQNQLDDYRRSVEDGTLGRDDRFLLSRTPITVDAQGCDEILELLLQVEEEKVTEIVERSKERRAQSGEQAIAMSVCIAGFKTSIR